MSWLRRHDRTGVTRGNLSRLTSAATANMELSGALSAFWYLHFPLRFPKPMEISHEIRNQFPVCRLLPAWQEFFPTKQIVGLKKVASKAMNPKIVTRNETPDDVGAIREVTIAAFKTLAISHHPEQFVIDALRAAGALTVSPVAETDGRLIGHIAFSPVIISDRTPNWYGLGPVSVLPEEQRKGIGKALIKAGLSRLKDGNAQGCCLVGHPDYCRKFGFKNVSGLVHEGVPSEVFFALSFDGRTLQGSVTFHEGSMRMANKLQGLEPFGKGRSQSGGRPFCPHSPISARHPSGGSGNYRSYLELGRNH
jgi:putative acetyltransferase